jgi:DnaA family protein
MSAQLPLGIRLSGQFGFDNFQSGVNGAALAALRACAMGAGERRLYLHGATATGKTHLLQATCAAAAQAGRRAGYLDLGAARMNAVAVIEGWEGFDLVCLDDLQAIAADAPWEAALFALFERLREQGGVWLAAGSERPAQLGLGLADLASRLAWGVSFELKPLDDEACVVLLGERARARGLELPVDAARYLVNRLPRDLHSLLDALDRLDHASLSAQRRLTLPFIRSVLEL